MSRVTPLDRLPPFFYPFMDYYRHYNISYYPKKIHPEMPKIKKGCYVNNHNIATALLVFNKKKKKKKRAGQNLI